MSEFVPLMSGTSDAADSVPRGGEPWQDIGLNAHSTFENAQNKKNLYI